VISSDAPTISIKRFRTFASPHFGKSAFSSAAREALLKCVRGFTARSENKLLDLMKEEYRLFKVVERQLCLKQVTQLFQSIDGFLKVAATIMNRRKSRGASDGVSR
jgi:hypothetical protein